MTTPRTAGPGHAAADPHTHSHRPSASVARRWPIAVGLLAAAAVALGGPATAADLAMVVVIAASCYVAAAATSRPWMAWAWIVPASVLVVVARLFELSPILVNGIAAVALLVVGVVRGAARPAMVRQTTGLVVYGLLVLVALALPAGPGLLLAGLTLIGHGAWDLWHLRRHRDEVSPSLAEACVALDVPAGLTVLVLAFLV